jgi:hypothetical protein
MPVYWENNQCGYCGFKHNDQLEKLTCSGEQAGVECCRRCGFTPEAPEEFHLTRDFYFKKFMQSRNG